MRKAKNAMSITVHEQQVKLEKQASSAEAQKEMKDVQHQKQKAKKAVHDDKL